MKSVHLKAVFLICGIYTIYTLVPNNIHFKSMNVNSNFLLDSDEHICASLKQENFSPFYKLLNKVSLRQFSYILISPLLQEKSYFCQESLPESVMIYWEIILLKNYLKKFKLIYKRYFLRYICNLNKMPTDKEINYFAIASLFMIVGV